MERGDAVLVGLVHAPAIQETNHGALHTGFRIVCWGRRDKQSIKRNAWLQRGTETFKIQRKAYFDSSAVAAIFEPNGHV
jgi:hypothetical protein